MLKNILILTVIILSGCGFHLRGNFKVPQDFTTLQISSLNKYDPLYKTLRHTLANNNIAVTSSNNKTYTLTINNYSFKKQELFRDSDGRTNRTRLTLTITYQLTNKHGVAIKHSKVVSARNVDIDPNAILTSNSETNIVRKELLQDATHKLIRQILAAIAK